MCNITFVLSVFLKCHVDTGIAKVNRHNNLRLLCVQLLDGDYQKLFIFRTEKLNFHNLVSSYSNKLYLKFYIHAFGSDIGNLYVYISHLDKCTESSAYKLAEYGPNTAIPWSGFTSSNSPWQEKIIDISRFSSRAIAATQGWYLYFVSCNATGQKSDLCIDQIQIVETGLFNKVYQFLDQTAQTGSSDWAPSLNGDIGQSGEAHQWANFPCQ